MAYRDNWLRHLMAPLTGEGLSNALARDFWRTDEDLWSVQQFVPWRWLKLLWVYAASAICQLTAALLLVFAGINLYDPVPLKWWWIGVGGATVAMLLFAAVIATATCIDIWRIRRLPPSR